MKKSETKAKKLQLNKDTVRILSEKDLKEVAGGGSSCTCDSMFTCPHTC